MKFIKILVEGQTEETFVRDILNPYFASQQLFLDAIVADTKKARGGKSAFKGGGKNYAKIENSLRPLFYDSSALAVTTMFDLYELAKGFPGLDDEDLQLKHGIERAEYLEEKWREQFSNHHHFIPYLAVHEFEALLFTKPEIFAQEIPEIDENIVEQLQVIRKRYQSPEEINLDEPPSKRILDLIPSYRKTQTGILIAVEIGIEAMRQECPHFDAWLKKLEALEI